MPNVSVKNIARAVYESSKGKDESSLSDLFKNTTRLIYKKHLLNKSKEILLELEKIIYKENDTIKVKASSKTKIDKVGQSEIEDFIKKRYKVKNVILDLEINEKLLGGIKIQVGDEIIDTTFKNKLRKLENYLINN